MHQATTERQESKRGGSVKKPSCIREYNKYMKGVDRADQYLSYYSILRKTMKWSKKVMLWLLNCALSNAFRVYKYHNSDSLLSYKHFLLETANYWAAITLTQTKRRRRKKGLKNRPLPGHHVKSHQEGY